MINNITNSIAENQRNQLNLNYSLVLFLYFFILETEYGKFRYVNLSSNTAPVFSIT